jgi:WD40 repeat protein
MQSVRSSVRSLPFIASFAALFMGSATAQEAYIYDYMPNQGVYAYDASSTGKLTPINGSPFKIAGQMVGTNGSYFVTADSTTLYSYKVESNGAIGKQVSDIDTQHYSGSECGTIDTPGDQYKVAQFDHTGQSVYVHLYGAQGTYYQGACDGIQTYGVSKSGTFTFKRATELNQQSSFLFTGDLPTLTGNGKFGFGFEYDVENEDLCNGTSLNLFATESGGVLEYRDNIYSLTPAPPSGFTWLLQAKTDDPTDRIVLAMNSTDDNDCEDYPITFGPTQLASYTVDSEGNLTTTNTYETMPSLPAGNNGTSLMRLDPSGKVLAVATGTGVAFFHFNGASPLTPFTGIIGTSGSITLMAWDSDGRLYAQNSESGKLHVYEATTSAVKELPGSPTVIPFSSPDSSIVVRTK